MRSVDARELRAVPTDPNALVRAATEDAALPTSVVVHLDLAPDLPRVNLDPDGMHQVFQNLIDNAAQAMPDGGRLTITSRVEHGQVHITFSDTGTGIAPEATQSVFDPLYTTKAKGFGLGLSIVSSWWKRTEVRCRLEPARRRWLPPSSSRQRTPPA